MTKHSKNNTASSVFSYAEYKKTEYGTKRQRLGNESMRQFNACALCLQTAREPLACNEGHLFCKECVYTDLLKQKKDIKRQKDKLEALKKEAEEEKIRAKVAARERVLKEFERGQLGLGIRGSATTSGKEAEKGNGDESRGIKRKFDFSPGHVDRLAAEAEEVALKQIQEEQAAALKHKLPDFWLPSLTPTYSSTGPPKDLSQIKVRTTCKGGQPHDMSLKSLTPVEFSYEKGSEKVKPEDRQPMCPSCKKRLSNSILMMFVKPCHHVVCKTCSDTLAKPAMQCVVCDKELVASDIVPLQREGTGFASGGLAETSRKDVAFQG